MIRNLLRVTSLVAAMRLLGIVLQFVWFVLLVHVLPIQGVGAYSVVNTFWILLRALGPLGADQALIREGGVLLAARNLSGFKAVLHLGIKRSIAITGVVIIFCVGLSYLFLQSTLPLGLATALAVICAALSYMLFGFYSAVMLTYERQLAAHGLESLLLPLSLILLGSLLHYGNAFTLNNILLVQSAISIIICLIYAIISYRVLGRGVQKLEKTQKQHFSSLSWRLFGTIAFNNINTRAPVLVAPFIIGVSATALLETALRFASLLGVIQWCVAFVIAPKIAKCDPAKETKQLQDYLIIGCWMVFVPACFMFLGFALFGQWFLNIAAGVEYRAAYAALLILAGGFLANASSGPITHFYLMLGYEKQALRISISETLTVLVLLLPLGVFYGVEGMAWAMAIGLITRNILLNVRLTPLLHLKSGVWSSYGWARAFYVTTHLKHVL